MSKILELRNIEFTYYDGTKALKNINVDFVEGEKVAIIGPNGSGKTTLLLVLAFLYTPSKGTIKLFNNGVEVKDKKKIRESIGIVFQDPDVQIFNQSVFDEVSFSLLNSNFSEDEVRKETENILRRLRLDKVMYKMPHRLSFGEKRKLTIASVVIKKPRILLLDEPTSNLDPKSRKEILELLEEVSKDSTFILSTHDLDIAEKLTERAIVLYNGEIVYDGKTREIKTNKEILTKYDLI